MNAESRLSWRGGLVLSDFPQKKIVILRFLAKIKFFNTPQKIVPLKCDKSDPAHTNASIKALIFFMIVSIIYLNTFLQRDIESFYVL